MSNFNKEYIEHRERKIQDILNDEREGNYIPVYTIGRKL